MSISGDEHPWLSSKNFTIMIMQALKNSFKDNSEVLLIIKKYEQNFLDSIQIGYESTVFSTEFKRLRLTEKLKDAIANGTITSLDKVRTIFADIYQKAVLDLYDEEGNLLDGV